MGRLGTEKDKDEDDDFSLSSITILRSLQCWPLLESAMLIDFVCFILVPADRLFLEPTAVQLRVLVNVFKEPGVGARFIVIFIVIQ
jgi:hypothetical protein